METQNEIITLIETDVGKCFVSGNWVSTTLNIANTITSNDYENKDETNSIYLLEELKNLIIKHDIDEYMEFLSKRPYIFEKIKENEKLLVEFKQVLTPLIYFLVHEERYGIKDYDVFSDKAMEQIYSDLGISYA